MSGIRYTKAELRYIKKHYPNDVTMDIAIHLNRTERAIYQQATNLKLHKSVEFKKKMISGECIGKGESFRFKKGMTPWNKGIHFSPNGGEHTRFRPGNKPHGAKYDGAVTIRNQNNGPYKFIRISERHWISLHQYNWEQVNGKIPKGHLVVFKNPNLPDREHIDNLEMISRAENMRRNSKYQYPPELQEVIILKNKLKKIINEQKNNNG